MQRFQPLLSEIYKNLCKNYFSDMLQLNLKNVNVFQYGSLLIIVKMKFFGI